MASFLPLVLYLFALWSPSSAALHKAQLSDTTRSLSDGLNRFAANLAKEISENTKGNVFFSPVSIATCLAMLYYMLDGESAKEVARAAQFSTDDEQLGASLGEIISLIQGTGSTKMAFKTYIQNSFPVYESYKEKIKQNFHGESENIDFHDVNNALQAINSWVEEKTDGKIKNLMDRNGVNVDTVMVLLSAIYFKGNWLYQFDSKHTKERKFYLDTGSHAMVPMMKITKKLGCFTHAKTESTVLHIPYNNQKEVMVIILPQERSGLRKTESVLHQMSSADLFSEFIDNAKYIKVKAIIPKMKFEQSIELTSVLQKLGISKIFDDELSDFSKGVNATQLKVSTVQHKAFIETDEVGTRAAAATGIGIVPLSLPLPLPEFRADHPFVFFIANKAARSLLFWGRFSEY